MSELTDNIKRLELALDDDETLSNGEKFVLLGKRPAEWVPVTETAYIDVMDVLEDEQGVYLVEAVDRDAGRIRIKRAD